MALWKRIKERLQREKIYLVVNRTGKTSRWLLSNNFNNQQYYVGCRKEVQKVGNKAKKLNLAEGMRRS